MALQRRRPVLRRGRRARARHRLAGRRYRAGDAQRRPRGNRRLSSPTSVGTACGALGREPDELERRVEPFLESWRSERSRARAPARPERRRTRIRPGMRDTPRPDDPRARRRRDRARVVPRGDYEKAIQRGRASPRTGRTSRTRDYCARLDGNIKWMRDQDVPVRAVAPIIVDDYLAWCDEHDEDPEQARASYAAHRMSQRRSDRVAARAQRVVLVRVAAQVQEVLRPAPRRADARSGAVTLKQVALRRRAALRRLR